MIDYLGAGAMVHDLLDLADDALGGVYVKGPGDPSLGDINDALTAYNEGFAECRVFIEYTDAGGGSKRGLTIKDDDGILTFFNVYPNPFNQYATFEFVLSEDSKVKLEIYDLSGKIVTRHHREVNANTNSIIDFVSYDLPTGMYLYRFSTKDAIQYGRINLIK